MIVTYLSKMYKVRLLPVLGVVASRLPRLNSSAVRASELPRIRPEDIKKIFIF